MKLPGILLLLTVLTTTGHSLICKSCWHFSYSPCDGPPLICPPNHVCIAALTTVSIEGRVTPQYSISCGTSSQCNLTGSFTTINGKLLTGTSCCSTDNCSPSYPILPNQNSQKNGLTCRACKSELSDYCSSSKTLECTGEESKCGRMARKLSGTITQKQALRGCTTRTFCSTLGNQASYINGLYTDMKMYCSNGATNFRVGYFISIFTALMIKFSL